MGSVGARGRPLGRPTDCTPERVKRIEEDIREGLTFKLACERAGIHPSTANDWIRWGTERPDRAPYGDFAARVTRARADLFESLVRTVKTAAKKDWRAASWILERRDPDAWSRRTEITGADGGPVATVDLTAQLDAALKARSSRDLGIPAAVLPDDQTLDGAALLVSTTGPARSLASRDVATWTVDAEESEEERQEARRARRAGTARGNGRF